MNYAEMVYSLYVVLMGAVLVAGIVEGSKRLAYRWQVWSIRREIRRAERAADREYREWTKTW